MLQASASGEAISVPRKNHQFQNTYEPDILSVQYRFFIFTFSSERALKMLNIKDSQRLF